MRRPLGNQSPRLTYVRHYHNNDDSSYSHADQSAPGRLRQRAGSSVTMAAVLIDANRFERPSVLTIEQKHWIGPRSFIGRSARIDGSSITAGDNKLIVRITRHT